MRYIEIPYAILPGAAPECSRALPYIPMSCIGSSGVVFYFFFFPPSPFSFCLPTFLSFFLFFFSFLQLVTACRGSRRSIFRRGRGPESIRVVLWHGGSGTHRSASIFAWLWGTIVRRDTENLFMYRRWCYSFNGNIQTASNGNGEVSANRIGLLCRPQW
jgi:hypothetical protein